MVKMADLVGKRHFIGDHTDESSYIYESFEEFEGIYNAVRKLKIGESTIVDFHREINTVSLIRVTGFKCVTKQLPLPDEQSMKITRIE